MPRSGVIRGTLAALFISLAAALAKLLSGELSTFQIIFLRCALPLPFLLLWLRYRRLPLKPKNWQLILLRSASGFVAMALYFWAISKLPLGDAILIGRLQPVIVALLAALLLRELPRPLTITCVAGSFIGIILILQSTFEFATLGGLAMVGCAFLSAIAHTTLRRLSADDGPEVIVFSFGAFVAILSLPLSLTPIGQPNWHTWLAVAGIALCATVGQLFLTSAYAADEAPVVSAAGYSTAVFAVLWGFLLWGDIPSLKVAIGGLLVVGFGLLLIWSRRHYQPAPFHRQSDSVNGSGTSS